MKPQNFEEKVVWYTLLGTYGWYFLGALYIITPALAWFLTLYLGKKLWNQTENTPDEEKITIPSIVWAWIIFMLIMELALIIGHINFDLGVEQIISSSIFRLARSTALLALFPLIGCLSIRPQLIYRAVCVICLESLVFILIGYLASTLHLPALLYNSPLRVIGRNSELFYNVSLYGIGENNEIRLTLFAPWSPALGLVANIYFFLASQESDRKWQWVGMIGAIAMAAVSLSRLAVLCLPIVLLLTWVLTNFTRPFMQITAGVASFLTGIFAPMLIDLFETFQEGFTSVRPGSSKIRSNLNEIALYRWWNEAPIWGHGNSDPRGPQVVAGMPIGSHHTWFGLLFLKGIVGFIALAVPFLWSFIDLFIKAPKSKAARVGLSMLLVLFLFTFGEQIDDLSYIYWPGLVIMGIAFKEKVPNLINTNKKYSLL